MKLFKQTILLILNLFNTAKSGSKRIATTNPNFINPRNTKEEEE